MNRVPFAGHAAAEAAPDSAARAGGGTGSAGPAAMTRARQPRMKVPFMVFPLRWDRPHESGRATRCCRYVRAHGCSLRAHSPAQLARREPVGVAKGLAEVGGTAESPPGGDFPDGPARQPGVGELEAAAIQAADADAVRDRAVLGPEQL